LPGPASLFHARLCINHLVSKGATADGSTMVNCAADSPVRNGEHYRKSVTDWPVGTMVTLFDPWDTRPLGEILQVSQTFQVIGLMNEHQDAIGETPFRGVPKCSNQQKL